MVADFNRDGKPDIAGANNAILGTVSVMLGNGDGTFQPALQFSAGANSREVAVGDFNRDGVPDLAVGNSTNVAVLLGNGDGTFQSPQSFIDFGSPLFMLAGDFNNDGKPDIATIIGGGFFISVLINNTAQ